MAEETINEVIERTEDYLHERQSVGAHTQAVLLPYADVRALLKEIMNLQTRDNWSVMDHERMQAELETLRAERDALDHIRTLDKEAFDVSQQERWRLQAENAALRDALQSVYDTASTPLDPDDDDETEMRNRLDQIETRAYEALWTDDNAALNTQAQAEWTPSIGDKVRFVEGAEPSWIVGMVGHITHISADTNQYAITMVAEKVERYGIRRSEFIKFGE